ncbi:MAG: reverse transcriptase domain-containing protein, partial [Pseudomonadota bacterium]
MAPSTTENPREATPPIDATPHLVPETLEDLPSPTSGPRDASFQLDNDTRQYIEPSDPDIIATQRKRQRLATIHERLGHLSFGKLKMMARAGIIPRELANVDPPTCPGCAYGKAQRRAKRVKGIRNRRHIKPATKPGQVISVDQLVSPTAGFVPTHRDKPTRTRYTGATVFVDHFSDFTYVHLMTKMNADTTVKAKSAFERLASSHGVHISHYHADNGLFDTKTFRDAIQKANQTLSFCGVNAHHQNGKAENRIKDITKGARTALLHATHRWPKAINAALWPSALKHYTNLRNAIPTRFVPEVKNNRKIIQPAVFDDSPISRFSGTTVEPNLDHFHPFGSPVYVLENSLQAQQSHNKWSDRTRVGIFLCHSPHHASNVPLILNTQTGNVSPQFHCIYDDEFHTCKKDAKFSSLWQTKAYLQNKPATLPTTMNVPGTIASVNPESITPPAAPDPIPMFVDTWDAVDEEITLPDVGPTLEEQLDDTSQHELPVIEESDDTNHPVNDPDQVQVPTSRFGRRLKPNSRVFNPMFASLCAFSATFYAPPPIERSWLQQDADPHQHFHPYALFLESFAFSTTSDPDTMNLDEAMKQPDRDKFIEAMYKELNDHIQRKHWKVIPMKSVPRGRVPIPMVWSMKRKRNPVGEIIKWKARLCAGGHRSVEGLDFWSTYSPVVSWSTVRLMITTALIQNWHMKSIDFVLAFPQAPVKTDIFMKPPKVPTDFTIPDMPSFTDRFNKVYKLIKNLYGLKDAGRTWFQFLRKGLLERGWEQSEIDTCVFTKRGIILILYVDDGILISPSEHLIQKEIESLVQGFDLTDDGDLKDYLGTRFVRHDDGSIELTQPRMVSRILNMVGLASTTTDVKTHDTPASSTQLLDQNPDTPPRKQNWHYRGVVGCLSYLQAMIRPDLTLAVQQCARFCNEPNQDHEEAVKRICRYLLKTKDRGLIMKPDKTRGLECFVDADWAGSWQERSSHDCLSAHSRTGFVIMFAGCPIMWN